MHSLLEERWKLDLIHIAYWEVNLRAVRLQLQRQDGEFKEKIGSKGRRDKSGSGSAVEDCEARRDCCSVKRRDEILSEKNEQNVSAIEGGGMEVGSGEVDLR